MEANQKNLRFYAFTRYSLGISGSKIFEEITSVHGSDCVGKSTVHRWLTEFEDGKIAFAWENSGRKSTETTPENIKLVSGIIHANRGVTINEIEEQTSLSHGTIQRIMSDHLCLRSVACKWVPHDLSLDQKVNRVTAAKEWLKILKRIDLCEHIVMVDEKWFYMRSVGKKRSNRCWVSHNGDHSEPIHVVKRSQFDKKIMSIIAVSFTGKYHCELVEVGQGMNSERYINFLGNMEMKFSRHVSPLNWRNMIFVQDNARPHVSRLTSTFFTNKNVSLLHQPPYSPDYNILDRFIHPHLEDKRQKTNFKSADDLYKFITKELRDISADRWSSEKEKLVCCLSNVIKKNGDYE
jgi:histone-lysine N-methyltransferase SETMAR